MGCGGRTATAAERRLGILPDDGRRMQRPGPSKADERAELLKRYKLHPPREGRGVRFSRWLVGRVLYGHPRGQDGAPIWFHRTRAFLTWLVTLLCDKAFAYLSARFGGRVTRQEYDDRQAECHQCDTALRRPERCKVDGKSRMVVSLYCLACQCGETPRARLVNKNWLRRWKCPLGKHEGSADWRELESECYVPPEEHDEDAEVVEDGLADRDAADAGGGSGRGGADSERGDGGPGEVLAGVGGTTSV